MSSMSCLFVWFSILTNGAHYKLMLTKSKRMPMRTALYISTYFTILFLVQVVDLFLHYLDVCGFDVSTNRNYPWIWYALMKLNNIFIFHHSKLVHIYIYIYILIIISQAWQQNIIDFCWKSVIIMCCQRRLVFINLIIIQHKLIGLWGYFINNKRWSHK